MANPIFDFAVAVTAAIDLYEPGRDTPETLVQSAARAAVQDGVESPVPAAAEKCKLFSIWHAIGGADSSCACCSDCPARPRVVDQYTGGVLKRLAGL